MTHIVTKPIPARQVVDVTDALQCLDVQCNDLPTVIGALIQKVCSTDLPTLDFNCLTPVTTVPELYQLLIDQVCANSAPVVSPNVNYELCQLGGWDCDNSCIVLDGCDTESTTENVVQALIARVNDLAAVVCTLKAQVEILQDQNTSLQTQVSAINDCCP